MLLFSHGKEKLRLETEGKSGEKDGLLKKLFYRVYLGGWWKPIICVSWAIFPCWPTRERSVFDMPVVLEKMAGVRVFLFHIDLQSAQCVPAGRAEMLSSRFYTSGMEREKKTWMSDSLRPKERKRRWNGSVFGSNESLHVLFFHSVFTALVQDGFFNISFTSSAVHTVNKRQPN